MCLGLYLREVGGGPWEIRGGRHLAEKTALSTPSPLKVGDILQTRLRVA